MAITTRDQLVTASQSAFVAPFAKNSYSNNISNTAGLRMSTWQYPGIPTAGVVPTTAPSLCSSATTGAIALPAAPSGGQWYLSGISMANAAGGTPMTVMDRYSHVSVNGATTAVQTNPGLGLGLPTRGDAYGAGVFIEINSQTVAAAATISYTNENGTTGRSATLGIPSGSAAFTGQVFGPFPLAAGDFGVRSVESITLTAAQSGSYVLMIAKQLSSIVTPFMNNENRFGFADLGLPALGADPCLFFLANAMQSSFGTTTTLNAQLTLVAG